MGWLNGLQLTGQLDTSKGRHLIYRIVDCVHTICTIPCKARSWWYPSDTALVLSFSWSDLIWVCSAIVLPSQPPHRDLDLVTIKAIEKKDWDILFLRCLQFPTLASRPWHGHCVCVPHLRVFSAVRVSAFCPASVFSVQTPNTYWPHC